MRVVNRQPKTGGKPQPSVGRTVAATRRVARRALRTPQSVVHSVIRGLQVLPASGGEIPELPFGDAANAARGAEPQRLAIVGYVGDVVAEQPVFLQEPVK